MRVRSRNGVACALLVALSPGGHPGPPVYLEVDVEATRVVLHVTGEQQVLNTWLGLEEPPADALLPERDASLRGAEAATARAALEAMLRDHDPVRIDGRRAEPKIGAVVVRADLSQQFELPAISFSFEWPCDGTPERVHLTWKRFEGAIWNEQNAIPVVFRSFGATDLHMLRPGEPEYVWHRAMVQPPERPVADEVGAAAPEPLRLPLVPLAVAVAVLASTFLLRKRIPLAAAVAVWVGGVAIACASWDWVRVPLPWSRPVGVPTADEAVLLFERLHRNVYAAFGATSEDEIYDLLARSVDRGILDELYGQIYESLVMRGQGGAVCTIEKVEVLEREAMVDLIWSERDPAPRFIVVWAWKVHGVVAHWGHEHRRVNRYEANYTVRHDGRSWKIADIDVIEHERVDR